MVLDNDNTGFGTVGSGSDETLQSPSASTQPEQNGSGSEDKEHAQAMAEHILRTYKTAVTRALRRAMETQGGEYQVFVATRDLSGFESPAKMTEVIVDNIAKTYTRIALKTLLTEETFEINQSEIDKDLSQLVLAAVGNHGDAFRNRMRRAVA